MKLYCSKETDLRDAENICKKKSAYPFIFLIFEEDFKNSVIKDFIDTYKNGGTPNPCIVCNKVMKFGKASLRLLKNSDVTELQQVTM